MQGTCVVGTAGPVGASFAVTAKNWKCTSCNTNNLGRRSICVRCKSKKPKEVSGQVWDEAALSVVSGQDHNWREALDPETKQIYYFNTKTKETRWDRPKEMGEAPLATGWFGRGAVEGGWKEKLDKLNEEYLKRPAVKQAEPPSSANIAYKEGSAEFNIWYGRYIGDNFGDAAKRNEPAKGRCKVSLHAGFTTADKKKSGQAYFCIMWAKGLCFKGSKCGYYHRVPTYADCGILEKDMMHDCFGRDRHAAHRDDMGGVGSFNSDSRSLFLANLIKTPYSDNSQALKEAIQKHFSEWGEIERVNVIWAKSIAFVRYRFRSHAELAKEAMFHQSMDHDEVLTVNWAHEDSNPLAVEAAKRANADAVVSAIKAAGHSATPSNFMQPANYHALPASTESEPTITQAIADQELSYPNTDHQYEHVNKKSKIS